MLMGYEKIGCDAINVGHYELAAGLTFLLESSSSTKIPYISANLKSSKTNKHLFDPYVIINRNELSVGVIGLTNVLPENKRDIKADDYIETGNTMIDKIKDRVDIVVMLINTSQKDQKLLTKVFSEADIIYTSGSTLLTRPMMKQLDNGPSLFSTGREGRYINVTELELKNDHDPIINVSYLEANKKYNQRKLERLQDADPERKLEEIYKDQENILKMIEESRKKIKQSKDLLKNPVNTLYIKNVPMDSNVSDDEKMLEFVNQSLSICNSLKN